ncbi:MAG: hypothetical protein M3R47_01375 [Chloroflexota bacterium]|nr:hypothetical protein [Chloroflexota bacterium]
MNATTSISAAQSIFQRDRKGGFAALNEIFRAGSPPNPPLDGSYIGQLIALDVAPGLNQFIEVITSQWMPWKGKFFNAERASGINIFTRDSLMLARFFWPLYRDYEDESAAGYRAFTFRTYLSPGLTDPDRQVLKLDYNIKGNPSLSIRRVLDELVQVDAAFYLGKAYLHWWWGQWQLVAYFSLSKN